MSREAKMRLNKILMIATIFLLSLSLVGAAQKNIDRYTVLNEYNPDEVYVPTTFYVGGFETPDGVRSARALLFFDSSNFIGQKIESAELVLDVQLERQGTTDERQILEVHRVLEDWQRSNWNTQPNFDDELEGFVEITQNGEYSVDITKLAQSWLRGEENFGILLKARNEDKVNFKEFTRDSYLKIVLERELTECEQNNGICRSGCGKDEKEVNLVCNQGVCCREKEKSDLTVSDITFKNKPQLGKEIYGINAIFENKGAASSGTYDFIAYVDDREFISSSDLESLDPGEKLDMPLGTRVLRDNNVVKVMVDSNYEVTESNEGNNMREETLSKEGLSCPDVYNPVCGEDGKTYSNYCFAELAGADVECERECPCEEPTNKTTCIDSDGGKNYFVKAKTCVGDNCKIDLCTDSTHLREYYCQSSDDRTDVWISCEDGCKNGACINKTEPICGNNICEEGEANYCPPCVNETPSCGAPCISGTCPQDCKELTCEEKSLEITDAFNSNGKLAVEYETVGSLDDVRVELKIE